MERLSNEQKKIIDKICEVQLKTSTHIFQEGQSSDRNLKNSNPDNNQEEFYNSLLDTTNYFKKLKDHPELIFEIDGTNSRIAILIIKYEFKEGILDANILKLLKFLISRGEK